MNKINQKILMIIKNAVIIETRIEVENERRGFMFSFVLAFQFLYFPEDKTEYIPAVINLVIFSILRLFSVQNFYENIKTRRKKSKGIRRTVKKYPCMKRTVKDETVLFYRAKKFNFKWVC